MLAVNPNIPVRTVSEFVAYAKAKKGAMTYASSGIGQASHLGMELFKLAAGFDAVHVPYKGTGPALGDAVGGQVDAILSSPATTLPLVKAGKLRALAVTSLQRSSASPDLPTIAESGYPGFEVSTWYGLLAPANTPPKIVNFLYEDVAKILKSPEIRQKLIEDGADPVGRPPQEFEAYIKSEIVKWGMRSSNPAREWTELLRQQRHNGRDIRKLVQIANDFDQAVGLFALDDRARELPRFFVHLSGAHRAEHVNAFGMRFSRIESHGDSRASRF